MKNLMLFLLLVLCPLHAQLALNTEAVKQMVVFIYAADANGQPDQRKPLGTGFLIALPNKGSHINLTPGESSIIDGITLLITARHIVDPAWAYCSAPQPEVIYMRVNKKSYDAAKDTTGVAYVPIRLVENGNKKYLVRSDDDRVDAAVIDVGQQINSKTDYENAPMRLAYFASPEETKKLRIGDSVASAGLLPKRSGENRNYPFFKFGAISNIPDEPVWIGCGGGPELRLEHVWFIAANEVPGNSGSPIFYVPPAICQPGTGISCTNGLNRPMMIGVQSSSFEGADVAGMTPIEDVFKIIEQNQPPPDIDLFRGDETKRK